MSAVIVDALFLVTCLVYVAASVVFLGHLMGSRRFASAAPFAPQLVVLATTLHAGHILLSSYVFHVCPVRGIHFSMSVLSVLVGTVYIAMRRRYRIDVAGAFVAPLALTFLLASRFVGSGAMAAEPPSRVQSAILPFHVAANLAGEALFMLAFAAASLYLLEDRRLKRKKLAGLFLRLPPLETLERAEYRFLLAGFPLLTIGILTGTLWARRVEAGDPADIARAAFGYVSWLIFALVLLLRAAAGWRGRRAAYGTIAGFGFSLLVLLVYLLRSTAHGGVVAMGPP